MNFSHRPNRVLRVRPALRRGHQQVLGQRLEAEPAIEAVGEGAKILRCIFCVRQGTLPAASAFASCV